MEVNNKILKRKFIGDIPEEEMELIEKACELEKSNRISLIRRATSEYAKKVLKKSKECENGTTT